MTSASLEGHLKGGVLKCWTSMPLAQCSGGFRALGRQLAPGGQASKMSLQEGLSGDNLGRGRGRSSCLCGSIHGKEQKLIIYSEKWKTLTQIIWGKV